eukprot:CAMPEP_0117603246 /NCGR_PEP_ID=MMETSP0784-20121206/78033_1 /TAXON_ID=39447 /ORGANISM="" /LENGTH=242 /DNA_ID=CAMNT_0005406161 /DNA_START=110 /DNA_END=837 /DNA_ORIENTATION=-
MDAAPEQLFLRHRCVAEHAAVGEANRMGAAIATVVVEHLESEARGTCASALGRAAATAQVRVPLRVWRAADRHRLAAVGVPSEVPAAGWRWTAAIPPRPSDAATNGRCREPPRIWRPLGWYYSLRAAGAESDVLLNVGLWHKSPAPCLAGGQRRRQLLSDLRDLALASLVLRPVLSEDHLPNAVGRVARVLAILSLRADVRKEDARPFEAVMSPRVRPLVILWLCLPCCDQRHRAMRRRAQG